MEARTYGDQEGDGMGQRSAAAAKEDQGPEDGTSIGEWSEGAAAIAERWASGEGAAEPPPDADWSGVLEVPVSGKGVTITSAMVGDGPNFHPPKTSSQPPPPVPAPLATAEPVFIPPTRDWLVSDLIDADYNPREITERELAGLADSIDDFGLVEDVVVNVHPERRGVIVGGHQKLRVLRARGQVRVPCKEVTLSLDRERELNARLNANGGRFSARLLVEGGYDRGDLESWGLREGDLEAFDRAAAELEAAAAGDEAGGGDSSFPSIDPDAPTKHTCPSCGFEWN